MNVTFQQSEISKGRKGIKVPDSESQQELSARLSFMLYTNEMQELNYRSSWHTAFKLTSRRVGEQPAQAFKLYLPPQNKKTNKNRSLAYSTNQLLSWEN